MDDTLKNTLLFPWKNASSFMSGEEIAAADAYCRGYIAFLNAVKTEREAVREGIRIAEKNGFVPWQTGAAFAPGDKVYFNQRDKALILCIAGKRPLTEGISIVAAHLDSPRLDLKLRPLYEEAGAAFFDTHYYGMVKAYQWTGIPLALHGYIVPKDGQGINVCIGEAPEDPVLFIADLLPHLAKAQMELPGKEMVKAEDLDVLAGLSPCPGESGDGAVKLNILRILYEKYGVTEGDLVSAELSVVPAFPARDLGLDRSMVGGYGQDDKVCAYPAMDALFSLTEPPDYCACVVFADKEETGSLGMTGMSSNFFDSFIKELATTQGGAGSGEEKGRRALGNSLCISADVNTAFYHLYADVFDPHYEAALNHGVVLFRYWGQGGKDHTNDAHAETVAVLRKILDDSGVLWQTGEGGRVDAEESGTLSRFFASLNIPSIDLGVPLLSMHSPFEAAAKADIYMAYRAFTAFFKRA
ncbi:probable M18 family aminopeptidase 1 [Treponema primitia ZAS-2]|uniref:M18 family aminopeptidase n=1 Tax=Treponema primitia (strain ATCC BAA-887 / DSM 12427 / ZAS-2) TaxID=545694 RepID=F5YIR5_TREPZ|nr:aminopeptidase [Treponema primitia]AEF84787.1 probable M18 family aminopeptidase 1 [Treponema primitia ZAS-2]